MFINCALPLVFCGYERERHRSRLAEYKVMKKLLQPGCDDVTGNWGKYTSRSFMICRSFTRYYESDKIKGDETDEACGRKKCITNFSGKRQWQETFCESSV